MPDVRRPPLIVKVLLVQLLLAFAIQAVSETANAQDLKREQLAGTWAGSFTTVYEGVKDESPLTVAFENGPAVTLTMAVPRKAKYALEGNTIRITFDFGGNESLSLTNVQLTKDSLTAEGHFPFDPSSISHHLTLSRIADAGSPGRPAPALVCGKADLSPSVQLIFERYQIKCPINVSENSRQYSFVFFKPFLIDLIKEAPAPTQKSNSPSPGAGPGGGRVLLVSVLQTDGGAEAVVYDEQSRATLQEFLTPILEDPQHLTIRLMNAAEMRRVSSGAAYVFSVGELKPEFRNGPAVNIDRVWAEVVNAALPLGINLDTKTLKQTENSMFMSQTVPRRVREPGGYIYFEYVAVSVEDRSGKRESLMVEVKSRIIRRKGYSSLVHAVDCDLDASKSSACSELPYLKAIINVLTGRK